MAMFLFFMFLILGARVIWETWIPVLHIHSAVSVKLLQV